MGLGLAALFLQLAACGGGSQSSGPACATPAAAQAALPAQATATELAGKCPARGVWSVLANLRITSYTSNGRLILPGAESGPNGFFVYDFEIPLLGRMASQRVGPFSSYDARLKALGLNQGPTELLAIYKAAYQSHPTAFLPQLFAQMNVVFDGDPQLTALQQWLLLVDGLVPPPATAAPAAAARPVYSPYDSGNQTWGMTRVEATSLSVNPQALAHLAMASDKINVSMKPAFASASTGVRKPGDKVPLEATVGLEPIAVIPFGNPYGSAVIGPLHVGPLENVLVYWSLTGDLGRYGRLQMPDGAEYVGVPTSTDPLGAAQITYQAGEDPGEGQGSPKQSGGFVWATPDQAYMEVIARTNYAFVGGAVTAVVVFIVPAWAHLDVRYHVVPGYDVTVVTTEQCEDGNDGWTATGHMAERPGHAGSFEGTGTYSGQKLTFASFDAKQRTLQNISGGAYIGGFIDGSQNLQILGFLKEDPLETFGGTVPAAGGTHVDHGHVGRNNPNEIGISCNVTWTSTAVKTG